MIQSVKPFFFRRHLPPDIGGRILAARRRLRLSRRHAAIRAGVAYRTLARIECGTQRPSERTLLSIAEEWGIALAELAPAWGDAQLEIEESGLSSPGPAIRTIRKRRGVTLAAAAEAAEVTIATLSRFERGMHAPRGITAVGDHENGAIGDDDLVVTSVGLANILGCETAAELTAECRRLLMRTERRHEKGFVGHRVS